MTAYRKRRSIGTFVRVLGFGCLAVALLRQLLRQMLVVVTVHGISMEPTFHPGDRILCLRRWPTRWLQRGQIVLVGWPWPPRASGPAPFGFVPFIKRVTGLPGDGIAVAGREVPTYTLLSGGAQSVLPQGSSPIPEGQLFVMGDNPSIDTDSRQWGPVVRQSVVGIALLRLSTRPESEPSALPTSTLT